MTKKKDDLKPEDENLEDLLDENLEDDAEDTSEDTEENPDDESGEEDSAEDDSGDSEDSTDELISMDAYKGLQRTLAKKEKERLAAIKATEDAKKEFDEYRASLDSSEVVLRDLQQKLIDAAKRVNALEQENKTNKVESMQSGLILKEFPSLSKLKAYIPSAETEEQYRKNCQEFSVALGEKVTEALVNELDMTTETAEDEDTGPTAAHLEKLLNKTMALAHPGKEKEYNKAMDEYTEALEKVK